MTRTIIIATILGLGLAEAVTAATAADTNGDRMLTIDEVQAAMPEVTVEVFNAMDTNADGALDADEVEAAQEAGLMPA